MNLGSLISEAKALLPRGGDGGESLSSPDGFRASEPGGASTPLVWVVVLFCLVLAGLWIAAGFFGLPSAQRFCSDNTSMTAVAAIFVPLLGMLLSYRSFNKHTASKVAIAQAQRGNGDAAPEESK